MHIIAVLGLALVVLVTGLIGSGTNDLAMLCTVIFVPAAIALYFSPSIVARVRSHPNRAAIFVLNLTLGWTLLGWLAALIWSHTVAHVQTGAQQSADRRVDRGLDNVESSVLDNVAGGVVPIVSTHSEQVEAEVVGGAVNRKTKRCPFCAEDIKAEAIKCMHCGSPLSTESSASPAT
jgi:hypothetical protein